MDGSALRMEIRSAGEGSMKARDPERLIVLLCDQVYPKPGSEFGDELAGRSPVAADFACRVMDF